MCYKTEKKMLENEQKEKFFLPSAVSVRLDIEGLSPRIWMIDPLPWVHLCVSQNLETK